MAVDHKDLTGAALHEPKGAETATAGSVYVSNGSGSGSWSKTTAGNTTVADPNNVFTGTTVEEVLYENYQTLHLIEGSFADISSVETVLLPIPFSCTIESIKMILAGSLTSADTVVTITRSDGAAMGTQTIAYAGSTEGSTFNFTPSGNADFIGGSHNYIKLVSDGLTTGTVKLYVQARVRRT